MKSIIQAGICILNFIYSILKLLPQQKKVVFLSRQSDVPSLDITMLQEKITELHPDYKTVILCKKLNGGIASAIGYCFHMLRQMYHLATSEIVILDSYCIAVSILHHRKNLLIIQMWHSVGTMKKFGYSILDKPEGSSSKIAHLMKMHANYDYILAGGDGYREHLADGFHYPLEKIVTLPLPRVERLKDPAHREEIRSRILSDYPQLAEKKNIVYVPTFRKVNDKAFLDALKDLCESVNYDQYNLIIKVHPLTDLDEFDAGNAIVDQKYSSVDMLYISDAVISDYSCIIYEAAILDKPLYFYTYDYEEYMSSREIYMKFKAEIPGPMEHSANALLADIDAGNYDMDRLHAFLHKYVYTESPHETEDIVKFVFEHKKI